MLCNGCFQPTNNSKTYLHQKFDTCGSYQHKCQERPQRALGLHHLRAQGYYAAPAMQSFDPRMSSNLSSKLCSAANCEEQQTIRNSKPEVLSTLIPKRLWTCSEQASWNAWGYMKLPDTFAAVVPSWQHSVRVPQQRHQDIHDKAPPQLLPKNRAA